MKRAIVLIMLLLIGGAIVNVAVTWTCALTVDRWQSRSMHLGRSFDGDFYASWHVNTVARFGSTHVLSQASGETGLPAEQPKLGVLIFNAERVLPWWCLWLRPNSRLESGEGFSQWAAAYGLPMRSMVVVRDEYDPDGVRGLRPWSLHGVPVWLRGLHRGVRPTWPVDLPLQPLWTGFVANTFLYAAMLWMFFAFPFALRRRRRLKRRLCPACAYPIGASAACTECGKLVRANSVEQ